MTSSGLRRRNVGSVDVGHLAEMSAGALNKVKSFDIYTKVQDEVVQKSQAGGAVTLVVSVLMLCLVWNALVDYSTITVEDKFTIDTRLNQKTSISFNMSFPRLRCAELSVDTLDSAWGSQADVRAGVLFEPLDAAGQPLQEGSPTFSGCLPCLEAAGGTRRCCNTCRSLIEAYNDSGLAWNDMLLSEARCVDAVGCRVSGDFKISKVSGNIHVALGGPAAPTRGRNVTSQMALNTSHEIHAVSFGDAMPGVHGALDGSSRVVRHGAYMFDYTFQLVPTVYSDTAGKRRFTNQYSVTYHARNAVVRSGELTGMPGVLLVYDFSPFLVVRQAKAKRFAHFLTSLCAIIGGAFSVASLVEMLLNTLSSGLPNGPLKL